METPSDMQLARLRLFVCVRCIFFIFFKSYGSQERQDITVTLCVPKKARLCTSHAIKNKHTFSKVGWGGAMVAPSSNPPDGRTPGQSQIDDLRVFTAEQPDYIYTYTFLNPTYGYHQLTLPLSLCRTLSGSIVLLLSYHYL